MNRTVALVAVIMGAGGFALGWLAFDNAPRRTIVLPPSSAAPATLHGPVSLADAEHRFPLRPEDVHADRETPAVAVGAAGHVLVAWASQSGPLERTLYLARSTDGGTRFETPVAWRKVPIYRYQSKSPKKAMTYSTHVLPRLTADRDGFWLGWVEAENGGPTVRYLVAHSTDGGSSFGEPVAVHGDKAVKPGFTTLALGADGALCAAWLDGRNQAQQPFFAARPASGESFLPDSRVFDGGEERGVCPCCDVAVARTAEGTAYVAFRNSEGGHRDIWLTRSRPPADGGFEPARPVTSTPWSFEGCPHDGPTLALCGDRLHLLWMDAHTGTNRIYSASSSITALSFSPRAVGPPSSTSQGHPKLAADAAGTLHAVWDESLGGAPDPAPASHSAEHGHAQALTGAGRAIMYAVAPDHDALRPPRAVSPRSGAFQLNPAVAVGPDGRVFVAWNELDGEGKQVVVVRLARDEDQAPPSRPRSAE